MFACLCTPGLDKYFVLNLQIRRKYPPLDSYSPNLKTDSKQNERYINTPFSSDDNVTFNSLLLKRGWVSSIYNNLITSASEIIGE